MTTSFLLILLQGMVMEWPPPFLVVFLKGMGRWPPPFFLCFFRKCGGRHSLLPSLRKKQTDCKKNVKHGEEWPPPFILLSLNVLKSWPHPVFLFFLWGDGNTPSGWKQKKEVPSRRRGKGDGCPPPLWLCFLMRLERWPHPFFLSIKGWGDEDMATSILTILL